MSCGSCRARRRDKIRIWLIAAVIVSNVLLFASNAIWLYCWMQYDTVVEVTTTSYTQDGDGVNIYGNENEVSTHESEGRDQGREDHPDTDGEHGDQNEGNDKDY